MGYRIPAHAAREYGGRPAAGDGAGTPAVLPLLRISNSYENAVLGEAKVAVDLPATNTRDSGCWLLIGDCGVGAVALSVDPSAAAALLPGSVPLGDTGDSGPSEQAAATAMMTTDAQATVLCCIEQTSSTGGPAEQAV
jgi:hypothetical protein